MSRPVPLRWSWLPGLLLLLLLVALAQGHRGRHRAERAHHPRWAPPEPPPPPRGKRYSQQQWTLDLRANYLQSKPPRVQEADKATDYEMEVRSAQNSSLCNYTVVDIPDPGGRIPSKLEHVRCNYVGSKCQERGTYCCIQTYRHVEVLYRDGRNETLKVYSGCICSLRIYKTLEQHTPDLAINN